MFIQIDKLNFQESLLNMSRLCTLEMLVSGRVNFRKEGCIHSFKIKGRLFSESFSLCLHLPKNEPNHYPNKEKRIKNLSDIKTPLRQIKRQIFCSL